jgi:hypothetical protein
VYVFGLYPGVGGDAIVTDHVFVPSGLGPNGPLANTWLEIGIFARLTSRSMAKIATPY